MSPQPTTTTTSTLNQRLSTVEQRQQLADDRMNKYDQFIGELRTNTAEIRDSTIKSDALYSHFVEEMKELKAKDVDIGTLLVAMRDRMNDQDKVVEKQAGHWSTFFVIGKWVIGFFGSVFLVFLGSIMSHLHFF